MTFYKKYSIIIYVKIERNKLRMKTIEITSTSPNTTKAIAKKLASYLESNTIVVLTGELGAGKTKFVEGFLSYFNLQDEISSPTFNIVNEYNVQTQNIYHFDVYRLEDVDEFYAIGGEEYFEKGISLIEWGEIIEDILPKEYIHITFRKDYNDENKRVIELKAFGKRYENLLKNF